MEEVAALKEQGNGLFAKKDYEKAKEVYEEALKIIDKVSKCLGAGVAYPMHELT